MALSLRFVLIVVGSAAYLALAVLGRGGFAVFFSHPPLVALAVVFFLQVGMAVFAGGNISAGVREDRGNRGVLAVFGVVGLLDAFLPAWSDRREVCTFGGDTVRWIGVVLFGVGGALRLWPVFVLGDRFSGLVAIQPEHRLVTGGVYCLIRHSSYLGLLLISFGWGLAFRSGVGVVLAALLVPPLLARIHTEEKLLRLQFGPEYEAYRARTWRLVPWVY